MLGHLQHCMHMCAVQALSPGVPIQLPGSDSCKPRGIDEGVGNQHIVRLVPRQRKVSVAGSIDLSSTSLPNTKQSGFHCLRLAASSQEFQPKFQTDFQGGSMQLGGMELQALSLRPVTSSSAGFGNACANGAYMCRVCRRETTSVLTSQVK